MKSKNDINLDELDEEELRTIQFYKEVKEYNKFSNRLKRGIENEIIYREGGWIAIILFFLLVWAACFQGE